MMTTKGDGPMDKKVDDSRVELELMAMRLIVDALNELPDLGARARVMRWAGEHVGLTQVPAPSAPAAESSSAAAPAPVAVSAATADLAFEDLNSLFESEPLASASTETPAPKSEEPEPIATPVRGMVKDFKRVAALDRPRA